MAKTTKAAKAAKPVKAKKSAGADAAAEVPRPTKRYFEAELPMTRIRPSPANPRKRFDSAYIDELAESIRQDGQLQPIAVRIVPADSDGRDCEIILGECRWRAMGRLGAMFAQATVYEGVSDGLALRWALIENLKRRDMNPIEEAEGFRELMKTGLTQQQVAEEVGRSRPVIANMLRLLDLPIAVVELMRDGKLTAAHGTALARFKKWPPVCLMIAELAAESGTPAGALERGLPFADVLENKKRVEVKGSYEVRECEEAVAKDPDVWKLDYRYYCFVPGKLSRLIADETAKAEEALRKKMEAAGKKGKPLDLRKLDYNKYEQVARLDKAVLKQLPEESLAWAKGYSDEPVQICTDVALVRKLKMKAGRERKAKAREKIGRVMAAAKDRLLGATEIGPEEMSLVTRSALGGAVSGKRIKEAALSLGIALPQGLVSDCSYGFSSAGVDKLAQLSAVDQFRLVVSINWESEAKAAVEYGSSAPASASWYAAGQEGGTLVGTLARKFKAETIGEDLPPVTLAGDAADKEVAS